MNAIWKFPLAIADEQFIEMPQSPVMLTVLAQDDQGFLYAMVNPANPRVLMRVITIGTGHPMAHTRYVGTYQTPPFVWHVFDGGRK